MLPVLPPHRRSKKVVYQDLSKHSRMILGSFAVPRRKHWETSIISLSVCHTFAVCQIIGLLSQTTRPQDGGKLTPLLTTPVWLLGASACLRPGLGLLALKRLIR